MGLLEIVEQIKESQIKVLEMDKQIFELQKNKNHLNERLEVFKLDICKEVYYSPLYKNDKQRELEVKTALNCASVPIELEESIDSVNQKIQDLEFHKSLEMINLTSFKNLLKVAEIEVMRGKANV